MSPSRKRPVCTKCGHFMIGHKRPTGVPECPLGSPSPIQKSPSPPAEAGPSIYPVVPHYINPNFDEPAPPPLPIIPRPIRNGSPDSWVSTEPADDIPVRIKREPVASGSGLRHTIHIEEIVETASQISSSSSSSSSSTILKRSLTAILANSYPLASLFMAPKEDVHKITRVARHHGLYAGILRAPFSGAVKQEDGVNVAVAGQRRSWWVLLGKDPDAVDHLMELQEKEHMARLEANKPGQVNMDAQATNKRFQFSALELCGLICICICLAVFFLSLL